MIYYGFCFYALKANGVVKWNREFRYLFITSGLVMGSMKNAGLWKTRKQGDLIEWFLALAVQDYFLQISLVSVSYTSGSLYCECIFFLQGILTLSFIANEEDQRYVNPFFRYLLNALFLKPFYQYGVHTWLWSLKHDMELFMPLMILLRIPFALYDPHWTAQLTAFFLYWSSFPFRYFTSK